MKTILLIILFNLMVNGVYSQMLAGNTEQTQTNFETPEFTTNNKKCSRNLVAEKITQQELEPVYFSYKRRQLIYKGYKIRGEQLINLCRNIPDSAIQEQINCYDNLSNNKKWILCSTIICGVSAIVLMNVATISPSESNIYMGLTGLGAGLSSGITAICSSIPHQKRKIIMFRDLPIVYNQYIQRQSHK